MNFPFYIAKRYLFAKSNNNTINIITMIASFGVIVGALALFIILSGFSGLRTFTYSLLDVSDPDIKITSTKGKSFFITDSFKEKLTKNSNIANYAKVLEERVYLQYKDKELIAYVKGVDENFNKITQIDSALVVGQWLDPNFQNTAIVGNGISYKLSIGGLNNFGSPLTINVPKSGKRINPQNAFNTINTQVTGVYNGTEEFVNKYVFVNLSIAQHLLKYEDNQISAVELKLTDASLSDTIAENLQRELGTLYKVQTKAQLNELFYRVINTENFVSYLIFTLIIIIALFNVIGAIIMMIIDKQKNLKTLYNLGLTIKEIKKVFVLQGTLLTIFGMFVGLIIGVILVFIQQQFGLFMITPELAYPVEFRFSNLLIVMITLVVLGYIAAKIASSRISIQFLES